MYKLGGGGGTGYNPRGYPLPYGVILPMYKFPHTKKTQLFGYALHAAGLKSVAVGQWAGRYTEFGSPRGPITKIDNFGRFCPRLRYKGVWLCGNARHFLLSTYEGVWQLALKAQYFF